MAAATANAATHAKQLLDFGWYVHSEYCRLILQSSALLRVSLAVEHCLCGHSLRLPLLLLRREWI
jgi:hypothetical protein